MAGKPTQGRLQYQVACSCGGRINIDARGFGRPTVCKKCGSTVTVTWGRDPKTRKTVPVAVAQQKSRAGVKPQDTPYVALCGCGYTRPVVENEKHRTFPCPGCGKVMVVEKLAHLNQPGKITKSERPKPTQPLLPLHLRPPLRTRIKSGAQFFDCPCGERNLVRTATLGKPTQCPACDRWHVVEELREAPAGPPPVSDGKPYGGRLPAPPKPAAPPRPLRLGEALCPCGEIIPPRTSRTGKAFACAKCGRKGRVEAGTDDKGAPVMKAVVTEEGMLTKSPVDFVNTEVAFQEIEAEAPPAPEVDGFFQVIENEDDAPLAIPDDAQTALCECGAELLVSSADIGHPIQCPACSLVMTVEGVQDRASGTLLLRIRPIGKMDEEHWSMDDFK
jgi:predicted RNA-binding Zn-ribbon protein involved in translation (DUF1610 family)